MHTYLLLYTYKVGVHIHTRPSRVVRVGSKQIPRMNCNGVTMIWRPRCAWEWRRCRHTLSPTVIRSHRITIPCVTKKWSMNSPLIRRHTAVQKMCKPIYIHAFGCMRVPAWIFVIEPWTTTTSVWRITRRAAVPSILLLLLLVLSFLPLSVWWFLVFCSKGNKECSTTTWQKKERWIIIIRYMTLERKEAVIKN